MSPSLRRLVALLSVSLFWTVAQAQNYQDYARWQITYRDNALGLVEGTAEVNWRTREVKVEVQATKGKPAAVARGTVEQFDANQVRITLRGKLREAPPTTAPAEGAPFPVAGTAEIRAGGPADNFAAAAPGAPEQDTVHLHLIWHKGILTGIWSYQSDPRTERDRQGGGRSGQFEMDEAKAGQFVGRTSDVETWHPLVPKIAAIVVLEDQESSNPQTAPFAAPVSDGASPASFHWRGVEDRYRTLLVIGRNLPCNAAGLLADFPAVLGIENYRLVGSSAAGFSAAQEKQVTQGWAKAFEDQRQPDLQQAGLPREEIRRGFDTALVTVELTNGVAAGPKPLKWGGADERWLLQYGDNLATIRFVRPLRERTLDPVTKTYEAGTVTVTEATGTLYLPERIAIEVETRTTLPLDSIPVMAALGGARFKPAHYTATRQERPNLYRTPFFVIDRQNAEPGRHAFAAVDLRALVEKSGFMFVSNPNCEAALTVTPGAAAPRELGGIWREAFIHAAQAFHADPSDLEPLRRKVVAREYGVDIMLPDVAAMLMLRDEFIHAMRDRLAWLDQIKSDKDRQAFRNWVQPYLLFTPPPKPKAPTLMIGARPERGVVFDSNDTNLLLHQVELLNYGLANLGGTASSTYGFIVTGVALDEKAPIPSSFYRIPVKSSSRGSGEFGVTFNAQPDEYDPAHADELRRWRLETTQQAISHYRDAVEKSLNQAESIKDDNLGDLLKLTGISFGPMVQTLLPRVMKLTTTDPGAGTPGTMLWIPDQEGRARIAGVATLAAAVQAGADYRSVQWQLVILSAQTVLSVPAMATQAVWASALSLAANCAAVGYSSWERMAETYRSQEEVKLQFGAVAVLGSERLAEAEHKRGDWVNTLFATVADAALVWVQVKYDHLPRVAQRAAINRGELALAKLKAEQFSPDGITHLSPDAQGDAMVFMADAVTWESRGRPLSIEETRIMYRARRADRLTHEPKPPEALLPREEIVPADESPTSLVDHDATVAPEPGVGSKVIADQQAAALARYREAAGLVTEPAANSLWTSKNGKVYRLGKKLGGGASANVYEIVEILGEANPGKPMVIKFLQPHKSFGTAEQQLKRVQESYERLRAANRVSQGGEILFPEITEFHFDAGSSYLIQERLVLNESNLRMLSTEDVYTAFWRSLNPTDADALKKVFPPELQEAVVKLYRQLADKGMVAVDLSLPNIYFKRVNSEWMAGILDIDHLESLNEAQGYMRSKLVDWAITHPSEQFSSLAADGRFLSAEDFMEKMLEYEYGGHRGIPWIRFEEATGEFKSMFLDIEHVKKHFPKFKEKLHPTKVAAVLDE